MADGRMLRRKIARSQALNGAIRALEAERFGLGAWGGLLVTWLIPFQDREGRVPVDAGWILTEVFPLQPQVTSELLDALLATFARHGVFLYYADEQGRRYVQFGGFKKCNKVPPGEAQSLIPAPTPTSILVQEDQGARISYQCALPFTPGPSGIEVNRREGKEETLAPLGARVCSPSSVPASSHPPASGPASTAVDSPPPGLASAAAVQRPAGTGSASTAVDSPPPDQGSPTEAFASAEPPPFLRLVPPAPGSASIVSASPPPGLASAEAVQRPAGTGPASSATDSPPPDKGSPTQEKRAKSPMPFSVAHAAATLERRSNGRISLGLSESAVMKSFAAPVTALIRENPDIADWELVADAFAAGLESWRTGAIDVRALVKGGNFALWLREARAWHDKGRPSLAAAAPSARRSAATGLVQGGGDSLARLFQS